MESYESKVKAAVTRLKFGIAHQKTVLQTELMERRLGLSYNPHCATDGFDGPQTFGCHKRSVRGCNYK